MKIKRHQLRKILHEVLNTDLRDEIALSASLGAEGAEQNDLLNEMSLLRLLEVDTDGSGDLSPDELRDLADDLEGEPITGQELRDALISNISDMHKDIYGKRPDAHDLRQLPTEELEQEHHKTSEAHKDWWYEERHREDQDMWIADEDAEIEALMDPEEGEDEPKQIGMGRRPLVGPARDVRRGRKISESKKLSRSELKSFFRMIIEDSLPGTGLVSVETALQEKLVAVGVPESWVIEVVNELQNTTPLNAMHVAQLDSQSDLLKQELQTIEDKWSKSVDTNWATWKTDSVPTEVVDQVATLVKEKIVV